MGFERYPISYRSLVVGVEEKIPLANGAWITGINFDNAATTPPFYHVMEEIYRFAPWYSSIHRGTGYKSRLSSSMYEMSRNIVADFVGADRRKDVVIFVKNTTEAINKLSYRLRDEKGKDVILSTYMEHHSNDLPWRGKFTVDYIGVDEDGRLSLPHLKEKLDQYRGRVKLVTITGASNVTGYINPIHEIARMAHRNHARIMVDGAQLVPHVSVNMHPSDPEEEIDFLVFSGHKMYAPFGTGVLIGPKSLFEQGQPEFPGGGTVDLVTHDYIRWNPPPQKEEGGSPNVMGTVALSAAIHTLQYIGMNNIAAYEERLRQYAHYVLKDIPGIHLYTDASDHRPSVGIIPFNLDGIHHETTANILSFEEGIAVRSGCFCAQPYVQRLLKLSGDDIQKHIRAPSRYRPGVVRISFGLYNTYDEIDRLAASLRKIMAYKHAYLQKYDPGFLR
ncbi:MAG: aminotransferase class V-fold PLP-dependent enzyme [Clostridia bacterium]